MRRPASDGVFVATILLLALVPGGLAGQALDVAAIVGDWIRDDSNYDPNDQMRITIAGGTATLVRVPSTVHRAFQVGQQLWTGIASDGSVKVRGSDGQYYPATLTLKGSDEIRVAIQHSAAGNDQVWRRAGPTVDGDWVRIAPGDATSDGMKVQADGDQATVRFLPAAAGRHLRIGSRLWRGIAAGGAMQILAGSSRYDPAVLRLQGSDTLWVTPTGSPTPQLWVRPTIATAARNTFGAPAAGATACLATSLPPAIMDVPAGWLIDFPDDQTAKALRVGLLGYRGTPTTRAVVTDLEIGPVADLYNGFARAWHQDRARMRTFEETGLTEAELHTRDQAHTAQGRRMIDVEAYHAGSGTIFAAIWLEEREHVGSLVSVNLTSAEFGQEFQQRRGDHRLVDIEIYPLANGERRYAAVWHRSCAADNWRELRGMDRAAYQNAVDSLAAMGFRVIDFESYQVSNGQRYAAIWEQVSGRAWAVRSDRTLTGFLNEHHLWTDRGFRVVDFEVYPTANGDRYAGVWAENDARYRLPYRQAMDDSVSAYRARWRVPGVSVAVIQNGALVYARGFGWADSARGKEAWSETVYPIASVSKVLAGTLAARLEARGVIDLTRPTSDFVDSLPAGHTHTPEQLLAKLGCVVHYDEGPEPQERYYRWRRDALASVVGSWMLSGCTPGQLYHYSTHGYTLVGAALEEVTGKDIVQLMDEEIIRPHGLWSMQPLEPGGWSQARSYELAEGYSMDTTTTQGVRPNVPADHEDPSWKILGGGYQSNAPDLARFGWLTLDGAIVADSVRDNRLWRLLTGSAMVWSDTARPRIDNAPPVALGWEVRAANTTRGRVAQHGGTAPVTGRSYLTVYRDDDLVVAVLSNQRNGPGTTRHPVHRLAHALATLVLTTPPSP